MNNKITVLSKFMSILLVGPTTVFVTTIVGHNNNVGYDDNVVSKVTLFNCCLYWIIYILNVFSMNSLYARFGCDYITEQMLNERGLEYGIAGKFIGNCLLRHATSNPRASVCLSVSSSNVSSQGRACVRICVWDVTTWKIYRWQEILLYIIFDISSLHRSFGIVSWNALI